MLQQSVEMNKLEIEITRDLLLSIHHFTHWVRMKKTYQRGPVRVQIANFQRWHKLGTGHHQEVEIKEELELLVENLQKKNKKTKIHGGE